MAFKVRTYGNLKKNISKSANFQLKKNISKSANFQEVGQPRLLCMRAQTHHSASTEAHVYRAECTRDTLWQATPWNLKKVHLAQVLVD